MVGATQFPRRKGRIGKENFVHSWVSLSIEGKRTISSGALRRNESFFKEGLDQGVGSSKEMRGNRGFPSEFGQHAWGRGRKTNCSKVLIVLAEHGV